MENINTDKICGNCKGEKWVSDDFNSYPCPACGGTGIKPKYNITECSCMACGKEFMGEEPKVCCSGRECGCMGMPIEPVVCSDDCFNVIMTRYNN